LFVVGPSFFLRRRDLVTRSIVEIPDAWLALSESREAFLLLGDFCEATERDDL
jgi:hypothetical protein